MWWLSHGENTVWYPRSGSNTVGRGSASLILSNDKSVSRTHAIMTYEGDKLYVDDVGSRYGTFVDKNKLEGRTLLAPGDAVHFGLLHNEWRVVHQPIVICFSTMKPNTKLSSNLRSMSISIEDSWSERCTHLTMPNVTLTLKVVAALVHFKPIVTPDYWFASHTNFTKHTPLPDPHSFLPPVNESTLNRQTANFHPDERRGSIFAGRHFVFFSAAQMNTYDSIIEAARGKCSLLSKARLTKSQLSSAGFVVVQFVPDETNSQAKMDVLDDIVQHLRSENLRVVPESEIGLAVLYVSLDKYCNPAFDFATEIIKTSNHSSPKKRTVLAQETEEHSSFEEVNVSHVRIDETIIAGTSSGSCRTGVTEAAAPPDKTVESLKSKRISDTTEGPPRKKFNANETAPDEGLFNFKSEDNATSVSISSCVLNIKRKITKNKNRERDAPIDGDDDDFFNFIPENPTRNILNEMQKPTQNRLDIKRPRLDIKTKISTPVSTQPLQTINLDAVSNSMRWVSRAEPSMLITVKKEEDRSEVDALEERFDRVDLKAAIVIINDSLISKDITLLPNSVSRCDVANFKRFVKVRPLRPQTEVIDRGMLLVYEGASKNSSVDVGSDEDGEGGRFQIMADHTGGKSKRTRRL